MQIELDATHPDLAIELLGINEAGHESGNLLMTLGRNLPWLQDPDGEVWVSWGVAYSDVVIVDADGEGLAFVNLSTFDLAVPANYAVQRDYLIDAALLPEPSAGTLAGTAALTLAVLRGMRRGRSELEVEKLAELVDPEQAPDTHDRHRYRPRSRRAPRESSGVGRSI
jgi:hypothetical protein